MELRQSKRYPLKALAMFAWHQPDGITRRGEGYTRDISACGVFVHSEDQPPDGAVVKLEITLPSLRDKQPGALLRTEGNVVRSDNNGFAAAANTGFRMRFPDKATDVCVGLKGRGDGRYDASSTEVNREEVVTTGSRLRSRSWM